MIKKLNEWDQVLNKTKTWSLCNLTLTLMWPWATIAVYAKIRLTTAFIVVNLPLILLQESYRNSLRSDKFTSINLLKIYLIFLPKNIARHQSPQADGLDRRLLWTINTNWIFSGNCQVF